MIQLEQVETALIVRQAILSMCDIQILTGIGILLSGYIGLSCYISAYHWQLAVYLAWFSNITHVACLTVLRGYLHLHAWERNIRMVCMATLCVALIISMAPTAYFAWADSNFSATMPSTNARCFFHPATQKAISEEIPYESETALEMTVVSILLLFFNFASRSIKLVKPWADGLRNKVRQNTRRRYMRWLARRSNGSDDESIHGERIAIYLTAKLYTDLLTSEFSDVGSH